MILLIVQTLVAVLLIGAILLQAQGSGLSSAFGGSSQIYRSKRSVERMLITGTMVLAILFAVVSILLLIPR